jgi:hypothetical protein
MFKLFKFEKEIDEKLALVPMTARRKLDLVGLKIHLKEWTALTLSERLVICHFPVSSREEREVLAAFLKEAVARHSGAQPAPCEPLTEDAPDALPDRVAKRFAELALPAALWRQFDPDQRFVLAKFARDSSVERFLAAWKEFTRASG